VELSNQLNWSWAAKASTLGKIVPRNDMNMKMIGREASFLFELMAHLMCLSPQLIFPGDAQLQEVAESAPAALLPYPS
jgi:hypothetical protein